MSRPVALVAGVGRGTGGSVARRFAAAGYRVGLMARSEGRLKEFEAAMEGSLAIPCDVSDEAAVGGSGRGGTQRAARRIRDLSGD